MSKPKSREKLHSTSFAHPPKYNVAVNLRNGKSPHKVNATVRDSRVNVFGQHVDEIKNKSGEISYNFHGFSNEFNLPDDVDPDSLILTVPNDDTILIQGDKYAAGRAPNRKNAGSKTQFQEPPRSHKNPIEIRKSLRDLSPQNSKDNKKGGGGGSKSKGDSRDNKRKSASVIACEPNSNWVKLQPVSPAPKPCCPLCCGSV